MQKMHTRTHARTHARTHTHTHTYTLYRLIGVMDNASHIVLSIEDGQSSQQELTASYVPNSLYKKDLLGFRNLRQ